jgi:uracil-DNA glycosylase
MYSHPDSGYTSQVPKTSEHLHGSGLKCAWLKDMKPAPRLSKNNSGAASIDARSLLPRRSTIANLRNAARSCKACDLWKTATQTVFGEGKSNALIMMVGEQPGDQEDRVGRPFVGPAGKLLDEALARAGIDRADVYVTNVVKHFKWIASERGKRRIHMKPRQSEIEACSPWLEAELHAVRPKILVCMGATAAQTLLGKHVSVTRMHGQSIESQHARFAIATMHPSSILRAVDVASRQRQMAEFIEDLKQVALLAVKNQAA